MGGISSGGNIGGVNGSGSLGGSKSTMGSTMLDKHMAVAAVAHHSQQQHVQLAGGFLHHQKISSGDPLNSQSTTSHSSHPAHSGHLVNGTILKTALTNPSEVSPNLFLYFPLSIARAGRRLSLDEYRQSALCLSGIARIYNFTKSLTAERNDLFSMVSDKSEKSRVSSFLLPVCFHPGC